MERQGGGAKTVRGGEERDVRRERGVPTLARVSERGFDTSPRRRATSSNLGTYRSFYAHLTPTDSVSRRENKSLLRRVSSGTRDRQNRRLRAARRSLRALTSPSLCSTRNTAASDDIAGSGLGFFPPASSRAKANTPPPRECAFQSNANASSPGISVAGNAANPAECRPSRRRKSASFSFPPAEGFRLERGNVSRSSALASSSTLGGYGPTSRAPEKGRARVDSGAGRARNRGGGSRGGDPGRTRGRASAASASSRDDDETVDPAGFSFFRVRRVGFFGFRAPPPFDAKRRPFPFRVRDDAPSRRAGDDAPTPRLSSPRAPKPPSTRWASKRSRRRRSGGAGAVGDTPEAPAGGASGGSRDSDPGRERRIGERAPVSVSARAAWSSSARESDARRSRTPRRRASSSSVGRGISSGISSAPGSASGF